MAGIDPTKGSVGFQTMSMTIEEITNGMAYGTDNFGRNVAVSVGVQRAKGAPPAVGEKWILSKDLGSSWSFAAILGNPGAGANLVEIDCPGGLFSFFYGGVGTVKLYVLSTESALSGPGVFSGAFTCIGGNIGDVPTIWGNGTFVLDEDNNISIQSWTGTMLLESVYFSVSVGAQDGTDFSKAVFTISLFGEFIGTLVSGPIGTSTPALEWLTDGIGACYVAVQDIQANSAQIGGTYIAAYYRGTTMGAPSITDISGDSLQPGQVWIDVTPGETGIWVVDTTTSLVFIPAGGGYTTVNANNSIFNPGFAGTITNVVVSIYDPPNFSVPGTGSGFFTAEIDSGVSVWGHGTFTFDGDANIVYGNYTLEGTDSTDSQVAGLVMGSNGSGAACIEMIGYQTGSESGARIQLGANQGYGTSVEVGGTAGGDAPNPVATPYAAMYTADGGDGTAAGLVCVDIQSNTPTVDSVNYYPATYRGTTVGIPTPISPDTLEPGQVWVDITSGAPGFWIVDETSTPYFVPAS